jgi:hypothetical protein
MLLRAMQPTWAMHMFSHLLVDADLAMQRSVDINRCAAVAAYLAVDRNCSCTCTCCVFTVSTCFAMWTSTGTLAELRSWLHTKMLVVCATDRSLAACGRLSAHGWPLSAYMDMVYGPICGFPPARGNADSIGVHVVHN